MSALGLPGPCYFQSRLGEQSPSYPGRGKWGPGERWRGPVPAGATGTQAEAQCPAAARGLGSGTAPSGSGHRAGGLLRACFQASSPGGSCWGRSKKALSGSLTLPHLIPSKPFLAAWGLRFQESGGQVQVNKSGGLQETRDITGVPHTQQSLPAPPHPSVVTVLRRSQPQRLPGRTGAG